MEKTDWLGLPTTTKDSEPTKNVPSPPAASPANDWLDIEVKVEDPNAGRTPRAFERLVHACMRGTDRVMATDGNYMAFRPFNREKDKATNPRTLERVRMFLEQGKWKHIGTYDEVQIYELLEGNMYKNRDATVGVNLRDDMKKVATAAIERRWSDYHDLLDGMARCMKKGRDPLFARTIWMDMLGNLAVMIKQMGGPEAPAEREINEGFQSVRRARGIGGTGGTIMTLDSSALQKVGFDVARGR